MRSPPIPHHPGMTPSVMQFPVLKDLLTVPVDGGKDGISRRTRIPGPVGPERPEAAGLGPLARTSQATHTMCGPPYPWSRCRV